ncbi:MAG: family containing protein [Modestobacter sp.]|jgi:hypothetical protein|nr:family containing protein [Modestobacter sp.]
MIYELREYLAHGHAVQQVHDRFATATLPLFQRHGLHVIGFWVDQQAPERILYLLQFEDAASQAAAWAGFQADEDWKRAKAESEAGGAIVAEMTSRTLQPVPYWSSGPATGGGELL